MTLAELQQKANTKLTQFWTLLKTKQEAYLIKHDNYFQLITSPSDSVIDGVDTAFTLTHPTDQIYTVDVDFPWSDLIPFQICVDTYKNDVERGYSATVTAQLPNGNVYKRTRTLKDGRIRKQDYDDAGAITPVKIGEPYYEGTTSEVDTGWYQYIEEQ